MTSAAAALSSCTGSAAHASRTCGRAHSAGDRIDSAQLCRRAKRKTKTSHSRHCALWSGKTSGTITRGWGSPDIDWLDVLTDKDPATPPPRPPLACTNLGAARPGGGPHDFLPRLRTLRRRATGQFTPHWQSARQLGPCQPHEPQQLPHHRRQPHHPPPDRLRLASGGRGMNDGHRPRRPGGEWGEFFQRGGAMTPGVTVRLMAAHLTCRGISPPRSLRPLVQRAQQPRFPPPQLGTYSNTAVARMMARGTRLDGSSYSIRRTATITTPPPRYRTTTATRATNPRA